MTQKKKKAFRVELSGAGLAMWCGVVFILLAWSFVLGILVGRGSIPEKLKHLAALKKELAMLDQKEFGSKQPNSITDNSDASPDVEKLDFFQKLAEKKEDKILVTEAPRTKKLTGNTSDTRRTAANIANRVHYTVQVASFDSRQKASNLVQKLIRKGLSAYYVSAETKKGRYFRVRCGDYGSREEALSQLETIRVATGLKGFVCKK